VLGNLLGLGGFEYLSSEEVRDELRRELGEYEAGHPASAFTAGRLASLDATREVGLYAVDAIVRRSRPLQETREARGGGQGGAA
jgi:NADH-quinone oxidoreductase subunit G